MRSTILQVGQELVAVFCEIVHFEDCTFLEHKLEYNCQCARFFKKALRQMLSASPVQNWPNTIRSQLSWFLLHTQKSEHIKSVNKNRKNYSIPVG